MTFDKKITIKTASVVTDEIGNKTEEYVPLATVWADVNDLHGEEYWAAAVSRSENTVTFTVRYFSALGNVNPIKCRIVFREKEYDVKSFDNIGYDNRIIKIKAVLRNGC